MKRLSPQHNARMGTNTVLRPKGSGMASLLQQALRRKPVSELMAETGTDTGGGELERSIGLFQLSMIGIGAIVGTGIFVVIGEGEPRWPGPAMDLRSSIAAVACGFSALSALCGVGWSSIPSAGSAYTYTYATLGEIVALDIPGWDLLLEYGLASAAVAVGWSANLSASSSSRPFRHP